MKKEIKVDANYFRDLLEVMEGGLFDLCFGLRTDKKGNFRDIDVFHIGEIQLCINLLKRKLEEATIGSKQPKV